MKRFLGIAGVYWVLGTLGLALAIPPGYASPVFPAAGFALAAVVLFGKKYAFAVMVGSTLLNVAVAASHQNLTLVAVLAAFAIAVGSTTQAWIGATLVGRTLRGDDLRLESLGKIVVFLTVGGVIPCLVSATVGTSVLTLSGISAPENFGYGWWNWYIGDLLGVTTLAPLALGILQRNDAYWRVRLKSMVLPIVVLIFVAAGLFLMSARWERLRQNNDVRNYGELIANRFATQMEQTHELIGVLSHFLEPNVTMPSDEFYHITEHTLAAHHEISALSFNVVVQDDQREAFERATAKQLGRPDFQITERVDGKLVRAAQRPLYVVVTMINPLEVNTAALGFDIYSEPKRREAIERAIARVDVAATDPLTLVQDERKHLGMLLLHPSVHKSSVLDETPTHKDIAGFAVAVLKLDEVFASILADNTQGEMIAEISDPSAADGGDKRLFRMPSGDVQALANIAPWKRRIDISDRSLELTISASPRYLSEHRPWLAWAVGVLAMFLVSLFQILMLVITGRTSQIQRLVDVQTVQLGNQNQALASSEKKLNRVFDVMPEVVLVVDTRGTINKANARAGQVLGYDAAELVGLSIETLVPDDIRARHGPLRKGYTAKPEIRPMGLGKDLFARHKDGRNIPVEIALAPMDAESSPLIIVTLVDISQRIEKERDLRESEQRFRLMAENIVDYSILFLDSDGTISSWNKGIERIKGYAEEEIIGKSISVFYTEEDRALDMPAKLLLQARTNGSVENQGWRIRKNGSRFYADVIITAIRNDDGSLIGYAKITRDVTERKRLEDELKDQHENLELLVQRRTVDLEVAKEAAEAASRAKSAFLSMASHELRTPMNGIMGMIGLAKRRVTDPKVMDYLSKADRSAAHLLKIINDVLDISRIEANKFILDIKPFTVGEVLDHVTDNLGAMALGKGVPLIVDSDPALNRFEFVGDAMRIKQILVNLVGNALKFTSHGHVSISAARSVSLSERTALRFTVSDTGIGIHDEDQVRIFRPFEQADTGDTRKYGGTGLGLALCRQLVEAMEGSYGLASTVGFGSTFWIEIPVGERAHEPTDRDTQQDEELAQIVRGRHGGKRILIVEDEPVNQEIVADYLAEAGIECICANDGIDAIAMAQANAIDLIFMDINMPRMGGIEATRSIRALPNYARTPIIALTANAFTSDRQRCLEAGMNDHVAKPFLPDDLYAAVLRWLNWQDRLSVATE